MHREGTLRKAGQQPCLVMTKLRLQIPAGPRSSTCVHDPHGSPQGSMERSHLASSWGTATRSVLDREAAHSSIMSPILVQRQVQVLMLLPQSSWTSSHIHAGQAVRNHSHLRTQRRSSMATQSASRGLAGCKTRPRKAL